VPDDATLLPALGAALFEVGRMGEAIQALDAAITSASDMRWKARAGVERELVRLESDTTAGIARALHVADAAMTVLAAHDDAYGQCRAWSLRAQAGWFAGTVGRADAAWEEAARFAEEVEDERELVQILGWRATAAVLGPTPVVDAIRQCESFRERVGASPVAVALMANPLASLYAMQGAFDRAQRSLQQANEILLELTGVGYAVSHHEALVRLLADRPDLAEQTLVDGLRKLHGTDDHGRIATTAAMLAQALFAQGRLEEADRQCALAARESPADDIVPQVIWRGVRAKLTTDEALARDAVALVAATDLLSHHADALLDLAHVQRANNSAYQDAARSALSLYEQKGNAVGAARARSLLGRP